MLELELDLIIKMGVCCESETHQVTTENRRKKKSPKSSQKDVDTEWYRSYAGKVH